MAESVIKHDSLDVGICYKCPLSPERVAPEEIMFWSVPRYKCPAGGIMQRVKQCTIFDKLNRGVAPSEILSLRIPYAAKDACEINSKAL